MKLINLLKQSLIAEHGRYDLVSQFKLGNEYYTSLGLNEDGIETLQAWVNLLTVDDSWKDKAYPPEGRTNPPEVISDIIKVIPGKNIKSYVDANKSKNPQAIANFLKDAILKIK